ncbi:hypothetical protein TNCV_770271 [Trichonephila clavipes]|nr:hypothetical protein TNCV_770271 [Trichonephila clavipes]
MLLLYSSPVLKNFGERVPHSGPFCTCFHLTCSQNKITSRGSDAALNPLSELDSLESKHGTVRGGKVSPDPPALVIQLKRPPPGCQGVVVFDHGSKLPTDLTSTYKSNVFTRRRIFALVIQQDYGPTDLTQAPVWGAFRLEFDVKPLGYPRPFLVVVATNSLWLRILGDSGSPNFIKSEDKYYALGVTSHGTKDNSNPTWPVMYAKVLYFKNWIKKHVTDLPKP